MFPTARISCLLLASLLVLGLALSPAVGEEREETVYYNTKTHKYHCMTCEWAIKCTESCVRMKRSEAEKKGAACKICRGSCRE